MIEEWRTAVYDGEIYEGLYKVSNWGRILSLNYRNTGRADLMTPFQEKNGYLRVGFWKNGKYKTCLVHRLVAEVFLDNPENLPEINHKDEDKTNNFVFLNEDGSVDEEKSNLEWKNHRDNCNHGTRNERAGKAISKVKKGIPNLKLSKKVLQLSLTGELIREWESTRECERNGFDHSNVTRCCNGKQKTYKGFRWMYAEDYREQQFKELGCLPLW